MKAAVIREHGGPGSIKIERDFPIRSPDRTTSSSASARPR